MPSSFSYASEKEPKIEKSPKQNEKPEVVESAQLGKREKIGKKKTNKTFTRSSLKFTFIISKQ